MNTHDDLVSLGYKLVDDAWSTDGRATYTHNDDVDRTHLTGLLKTLQNVGWKKSSNKLRSLKSDAGDEIEIEPGGSDTSGHFLHHLKCRATC
jgi:hypothetical protein